MTSMPFMVDPVSGRQSENLKNSISWVRFGSGLGQVWVRFGSGRPPGNAVSATAKLEIFKLGGALVPFGTFQIPSTEGILSRNGPIFACISRHGQSQI